MSDHDEKTNPTEPEKGDAVRQTPSEQTGAEGGQPTEAAQLDVAAPTQTDAAAAKAGKPKKKRRLIFRLFKWAVIAAFGLIAAVFLLLLFLPAITDSGFVKGKIADTVKKMNGHDLKIARLRVAPLSRRLVQVDDLTISDPERTDGKRVVSVGQILFEWQPKLLFSRKVQIDRILVKEPRVFVEMKDGSMNVMKLKPKPAAAPDGQAPPAAPLAPEPKPAETAPKAPGLKLPVDFTLKEFKVDDFGLDFTMAKDGKETAVSMPALDFALGVILTREDKGNNIAADLGVDPISISMTDMGVITLPRIALAFKVEPLLQSYSAKELSNKFTFGDDKTPIITESLEGEVAGSGKESLRIVHNVTVDYGALMGLLSPEIRAKTKGYGVDGRTVWDMTVEGRLPKDKDDKDAAIAVKTDIANKFTVFGPAVGRLENLPVDVAVAVNVHPATLDVAPLSLKVAAANMAFLDVNGDVLGGGKNAIAMDIQARLDLSKIETLITPKLAEKTPPFKLTGEAGIRDLKIKGNLDDPATEKKMAFDVSGEAYAKIDSLDLTYTPKPKAAEDAAQETKDAGAEKVGSAEQAAEVAKTETAEEEKPAKPEESPVPDATPPAQGEAPPPQPIVVALKGLDADLAFAVAYSKENGANNIRLSTPRGALASVNATVGPKIAAGLDKTSWNLAVAVSDQKATSVSVTDTRLATTISASIDSTGKFTIPVEGALGVEVRDSLDAQKRAVPKVALNAKVWDGKVLFDLGTEVGPGISTVKTNIEAKADFAFLEGLLAGVNPKLLEKAGKISIAGNAGLKIAADVTMPPPDKSKPMLVKASVEGGANMPKIALEGGIADVGIEKIEASFKIAADVAKSEENTDVKSDTQGELGIGAINVAMVQVIPPSPVSADAPATDASAEAKTPVVETQSSTSQTTVAPLPPVAKEATPSAQAAGDAPAPAAAETPSEPKKRRISLTISELASKVHVNCPVLMTVTDKSMSVRPAVSFEAGIASLEAGMSSTPQDPSAIASVSGIRAKLETEPDVKKGEALDVDLRSGMEFSAGYDTLAVTFVKSVPGMKVQLEQEKLDFNLSVSTAVHMPPKPAVPPPDETEGDGDGDDSSNAAANTAGGNVTNPAETKPDESEAAAGKPGTQITELAVKMGVELGSLATLVNMPGNDMPIGIMMDKSWFRTKVDAPKDPMTDCRIGMDTGMANFRPMPDMVEYLNVTYGKAKPGETTNYQIKGTDASFVMDMTANSAAKNYDIKNMAVDVPGLFGMKVKDIAVVNNGQSFAVGNLEGKFEPMGIAPRLPPALARKLAMLQSGEITFALRVKGEKPTSEQIRKRQFPVEVDFSAGLVNLGLSVESEVKDVVTGETQKNVMAIVSGFNDAFTFSMRPDVIRIDNNLVIGRIDLPGKLPETEVLDLGSKFSMSFEQMSRLNVREASLNMRHNTIRMAAKGTVGGLDMFTMPPPASDEPTKKPAVWDYLEKLDVDFSAEAAFAPGKEAFVMKGMSVEGVAGGTFGIKLIPADRLIISASGKFEDMTVKLPQHRHVLEINGDVPFRKTLKLVTPAVVARGDDLGFLSRKVYAFPPLTPGEVDIGMEAETMRDSLRPYSANRNTFSIKAIEVKPPAIGGVERDPLVIDKVGVDVHLEEGRFNVDKFQLRLLGGGIVGRMFVQPYRESYVMGLESEFVGLNFKKLLPGTFTTIPDEEAEISGFASMRLFVPVEKTRSSASLIEDLRLQFNVTHIGGKALDRILLFLDPNEENPKIMAGRKGLSLGQPSTVTFIIANGNAKGKMTLQGPLGFVSLPEPEIPLSRILGLGRFQTMLKRLELLQTALANANAQTLVVLPDRPIGLQ